MSQDSSDGEHTQIVRAAGPMPGSRAADRLNQQGDPDESAVGTAGPTEDWQGQPTRVSRPAPTLDPAAAAARNAVANLFTHPPQSVADELEALPPSSGDAPRLQSNTGLRLFQIVIALVLAASGAVLAWRAFFWDPYKH